MVEKHTTRIDKWLWAVRIFKTRSLATLACTGGKVKIKGHTVKSSRMILTGDIIQVRKGVVKYEYKVIKIAEKRMGAKIVLDFIQNLTSEKELAKLKTAKVMPTQKWENGKGRPTKKERRMMDKLRGKY